MSRRAENERKIVAQCPNRSNTKISLKDDGWAIECGMFIMCGYRTRGDAVAERNRLWPSRISKAKGDS